MQNVNFKTIFLFILVLAGFVLFAISGYQFYLGQKFEAKLLEKESACYEWASKEAKEGNFMGHELCYKQEFQMTILRGIVASHAPIFFLVFSLCIFFWGVSFLIMNWKNMYEDESLFKKIIYVILTIAAIYIFIYFYNGEMDIIVQIKENIKGLDSLINSYKSMP